MISGSLEVEKQREKQAAKGAHARFEPATWNSLRKFRIFPARPLISHLECEENGNKKKFHPTPNHRSHCLMFPILYLHVDCRCAHCAIAVCFRLRGDDRPEREMRTRCVSKVVVGSLLNAAVCLRIFIYTRPKIKLLVGSACRADQMQSNGPTFRSLPNETLCKTF